MKTLKILSCALLLFVGLPTNYASDLCDGEVDDGIFHPLKPETGWKPEKLSMGDFFDCSKDSAKEEKACESRKAPEACTIKIYETDGYTRKDWSPDAILEYDPEKGEGKVYATSGFGIKDTFCPPIGIAEREPGSDEIIIRKTTSYGTIDRAAGTLIIEDADEIGTGDCDAPSSRRSTTRPLSRHSSISDGGSSPPTPTAPAPFSVNLPPKPKSSANDPRKFPTNA